MNDAPNPALLPIGLRDLLPPEAEREALAIERLMAVFASHGYERVKPPLLEFEQGLLTEAGAATADAIFRVMDPASQRMMGLRADMTPQVARIAATRLARSPRPLRLCYSGQVLRVAGREAAPERQSAQAGIELIGADSAAADAEMVLVATEALASIGVASLSVDFTLPTLVDLLAPFDGAASVAFRRALDRKDVAAVAAAASPHAETIAALVAAAGPAEPALAALAAADLPPSARGLADRLATIVGLVAASGAPIRLTVDPLEFRGFGYTTGFAFALFDAASGAELGRGGRYLGWGAEPATGVTLYPEAVLRAAAPARTRPRIFLPQGAPAEAGRALRAEGWATLRSLGPEADLDTEARRLGCSHRWSDAGLVALA